MGKLTYVLENERTFKKARVVLDGSDVHASHPENVDNLVCFKSPSDNDAKVAFQNVIKKYFHPRDGWRLSEKKPGVADLEPWAPPPPSEEELRAAEELKKRRKLGWVFDNDTLVVDCKKQKSRADIEIAFDQSAHVENLYLMTDGGGAEAKGSWQIAGALSLLEEKRLAALQTLTLDSPFDDLSAAAKWPLSGVASCLQKLPKLRAFAAVGDFRWPQTLKMPELVALRIMQDPMDGETVERIAGTVAPKLEVVQLALRHEQESDPHAEAALTRFLRPSLVSLSIEGLTCVEDTITAFLRSQRPLPQSLMLDGGVMDVAALIEACTTMRRKFEGTELTLGEFVMAALDEDTQDELGTLGVEAGATAFDPNAADESLRNLWQVLG